MHPASRFALSLLLAVSPTAGDESMRHVLLICVDDLKPNIGCYGDAHAITPNIDRLAANGLRFEAAYCNQAVCAPSRNSLLTGLRPQTLGIYDLGTHFRIAAPDAVTLGQHFKKNGYHTAALGKVFHVGHGNIDDKDSWSVPHWSPKNAPTYALAESTASMRSGRNGNRGAATENADVEDGFYVDGQIAAEAVHRIRNAAKAPGQPLFLAVGFIRPHLPFCAPKKYWDLYDRRSLPMPEVKVPPEGAPAYAGQPGGELRQYSDIPPIGDFDDTITLQLIHGYYAAISYMDAQLGKVLDALEESGLTEQTVIVLWGDHGWHLGDHGYWCKHTNYEQAARIPLIFAGHGIARGAVTGALVETVDIYPTLAEICGIPRTDGIDGMSFAGLFTDPSSNIRDSVIHVYPRNHRLGRAIRTKRYRMVEWKSFRESETGIDFELYDYQQDPLETLNIAKSQPEILKNLRAILTNHPPAKPQIE